MGVNNDRDEGISFKRVGCSCDCVAAPQSKAIVNSSSHHCVQLMEN